MPRSVWVRIENIIRDEADNFAQGMDGSLGSPGALAEAALPQPGGPLVREQVQEMAHNTIRREPLGNPAFQVGQHGFEYLPSGVWSGSITAIERIGFGKKIGVIVGGPADHSTVNVLEIRSGLPEGGDAAIDLDAQCGEVCFQPIHVVAA